MTILGGQQQSASVQSRFVASKVILRNFSEYSDRKAVGIDRPRAENLVQQLVSSCPDSLRSRICVERLTIGRGGKSDRVHIPVESGFAKKVAGFFEDALLSVS